MVMPDALFLEERRRVILNLLEQRGRVTVKELSDEMQVSEVTIRQDLRALHDQGLLERTYGGAVLRLEAANSVKDLPSFSARQVQMNSQKDAVAAQAASLVRDGYSIALDSSTTAYALTAYLKRFNHLTVVTNGLMVAQSFLDSDSQQVQVWLTGGRLRPDTVSLVGAPDALPRMNLNLYFFSARGVSESAGASEINPDEVLVKQAMIERCVHPVLLVDGSKWGQVAPFTILPTSRLRHVITSDDAPPDQVERFRSLGIQVDVVAL